ncbi:DUF2849 domain-containing protein [Pelagibacterium luteolum]|uniref:DUF2849 domain-containing protein n=1 Tax=Pelagibacterium luteolum TaxID=440168 RepID=A0A1G7UF43_9HYPH|nr:DUF2849 domain-containing protein [Pelagibacterium luteolum]SDG46103.1 Protein of unknown function [Pelagibacterium luteolum]
MTKILTGNELLSGAVVYLDADGRWVEELQAARVYEKDDEAAYEAALAAAKASGRVISLEDEDVEIIEGVITPSRTRAQIRAGGPTAPKFDRQHLGEDEHVSL